MYMEKDALAFQMLLLLKSRPQMKLTELSLLLKNRLDRDEDLHAVEVKESWEALIRGGCSYLKKLNFIKYNGSEMMITRKGIKYVNLLLAPIARFNKEDVDSCM